MLAAPVKLNFIPDTQGAFLVFHDFQEAFSVTGTHDI